MAKKVRPNNSDSEEDENHDGEFDDGADSRFDEEPDFSDPEDFNDDVDDDNLMPDLMPNRPKESDGVDSVIVVDGVPCVGSDRVEKLKNVIRKIFNKVWLNKNRFR